MTIEEKKKEIYKLTQSQVDLMKKSVAQAIRFSKTPPKKATTAIRMAFKLMQPLIQIRQIEIQKNIIISQPIPQFPKGGIQI